jgi:hypothetical protein
LQQHRQEYGTLSGHWGLLDKGKDKAIRESLRTPVTRVLVILRIELGKVMDLVWASHSEQNTKQQRLAECMEPAAL